MGIERIGNKGSGSDGYGDAAVAYGKAAPEFPAVVPEKVGSAPALEIPDHFGMPGLGPLLLRKPPEENLPVAVLPTTVDEFNEHLARTTNAHPTNAHPTPLVLEGAAASYVIELYDASSGDHAYLYPKDGALLVRVIPSDVYEAARSKALVLVWTFMEQAMGNLPYDFEDMVRFALANMPVEGSRIYPTSHADVTINDVLTITGQIFSVAADSEWLNKVPTSIQDIPTTAEDFDRYVIDNRKGIVMFTDRPVLLLATANRKNLLLIIKEGDKLYFWERSIQVGDKDSDAFFGNILRRALAVLESGDNAFLQGVEILPVAKFVEKYKDYFNLNDKISANLPSDPSLFIAISSLHNPEGKLGVGFMSFKPMNSPGAAMGALSGRMRLARGAEVLEVGASTVRLTRYQRGQPNTTQYGHVPLKVLPRPVVHVPEIPETVVRAHVAVDKTDVVYDKIQAADASALGRLVYTRVPVYQAGEFELKDEKGDEIGKIIFPEELEEGAVFTLINEGVRRDLTLKKLKNTWHLFEGETKVGDLENKPDRLSFKLSGLDKTLQVTYPFKLETKNIKLSGNDNKALAVLLIKLADSNGQDWFRHYGVALERGYSLEISPIEMFGLALEIKPTGWSIEAQNDAAAALLIEAVEEAAIIAAPAISSPNLTATSPQIISSEEAARDIEGKNVVGQAVLMNLGRDRARYPQVGIVNHVKLFVYRDASGILKAKIETPTQDEHKLGYHPFAGELAELSVVEDTFVENADKQFLGKVRILLRDLFARDSFNDAVAPFASLVFNDAKSFLASSVSPRVYFEADTNDDRFLSEGSNVAWQSGVEQKTTIDWTTIWNTRLTQKFSETKARSIHERLLALKNKSIGEAIPTYLEALKFIAKTAARDSSSKNIFEIDAEGKLVYDDAILFSFAAFAQTLKPLPPLKKAAEVPEAKVTRNLGVLLAATVASAAAPNAHAAESVYEPPEPVVDVVRGVEETPVVEPVAIDVMATSGLNVLVADPIAVDLVVSTPNSITTAAPPTLMTDIPQVSLNYAYAGPLAAGVAAFMSPIPMAGMMGIIVPSNTVNL